jgi:hypothetical protein
MARYRTVQTQKSAHLRGLMDSVGFPWMPIWRPGPLSNYYRNIMIDKHSGRARFRMLPPELPPLGSCCPARTAVRLPPLKGSLSRRPVGPEARGGEGALSASLWAASELIEDAKKAVDELYEQRSAGRDALCPGMHPILPAASPACPLDIPPYVHRMRGWKLIPLSHPIFSFFPPLPLRFLCSFFESWPLALPLRTSAPSNVPRVAIGWASAWDARWPGSAPIEQVPAAHSNLRLDPHDRAGDDGPRLGVRSAAQIRYFAPTFCGTDP